MIVAISVKAGEIDARVRRFDPVMEDAGDAACYIRANEVDGTAATAARNRLRQSKRGGRFAASVTIQIHLLCFFIFLSLSQQCHTKFDQYEI